MGALPRQALLFGELMVGTRVSQEFAVAAGLSAAEFVRQMARIIAQTGALIGKQALAELMPPPHADDQRNWPLVTQHFQIDLELLHAKALQWAMQRVAWGLELCEQSELIKTPFVQTARGMECIHPKLLFRSIECKLYDALRARGAGRFMNEFGLMFQRYVGLVLAEGPWRVIDEDALRAMLRGRGKCTDFAVVLDGLLILIDAKGIEGHYDELYHSRPDVLTEKLRSTVLYAIDQGVETLARLPAELRRPRTVFICVTYKQMNVGHGGALRDLTIGTDEWSSARWHVNELPPNHMFTISISELELLCGVIQGGQDANEIFDSIVADDEKPVTSRRLLGMHLAEYGQVNVPGCSRDAIARLCDI